MSPAFSLSVAGRRPYIGFLDLPTPPPVVTYPRLMRIKRDYEFTSDGHPRTQGRYGGITTASVDFANMKDAGPNVRYGMPDQYAYQPNGFIPMNEILQWLLMNVNCLAHYKKRYEFLSTAQKKEARASWASFVSTKTCFTNMHSYEDGLRDFIQPKNMTAKSPIGWEQNLCSNNLVMVLSPTRYTLKVSYLATAAKPYEHYAIQCVDLNKPLPTPESLLTTPWLCHRPEISTGEPLDGGRYGHEPFPQFDGDSRYFLMAKGGVGYYRCDWLEAL